jgi:hypothetical protein
VKLRKFLIDCCPKSKITLEHFKNMFYICSMLIQGSPFKLSPAIADMPGLSERFWYWQGSSGQKYIHSVYEPDNCPPLPGAVYVGVRRQGSIRTAVCVGRFLPLWELPKTMDSNLAGLDELHVHLLARGPGEAEQVLADLTLALGDVSEFDHRAGFAEAAECLSAH